MNDPVKLFTNGSFWACPKCHQTNISFATRFDVDINDLDPDFVDHLIDSGAFDHLLPTDEEFDEDSDFSIEGMVGLYREPSTVQCANPSCGEVYPTQVMSVPESDEARQWSFEDKEEESEQE